MYSEFQIRWCLTYQQSVKPETSPSGNGLPAPICIKDFLELPGDLGQSGLTLKLFPIVILVNQIWCDNCFWWKYLQRQTWLVRITLLSNENALYNWMLVSNRAAARSKRHFSLIIKSRKSIYNLHASDNYFPLHYASQIQQAFLTAKHTILIKIQFDEHRDINTLYMNLFMRSMVHLQSKQTRNIPLFYHWSIQIQY